MGLTMMETDILTIPMDGISIKIQTCFIIPAAARRMPMELIVQAQSSQMMNLLAEQGLREDLNFQTELLYNPPNYMD